MTTTTDPPDIEALAAAEHESWSGWMRYMLERIRLEDEETFIKLSGLQCGKRWTRQMGTPYEELSEGEKRSDRVEARKKLKVYRD